MIARRRLVLLTSSAVIVVGAGAATAKFTDVTSPAALTGTVQSLSAPTFTAPSTSTQTSRNVTVTWTKSQTTGGAAATSYTVTRFPMTNGNPGTGATACGGDVTTLTCTDATGADGQFAYRVRANYKSWTKTSAALSGTVAVDTTPPAVAITFPVAGSTYSAAAWTAGCGTASTDDVCGTATDATTGVAASSVRVAIQGTSGTNNNQWWNGTTWQATQVFNAVTSFTAGTGAWTYNLARPGDGGYQMFIQAADTAGNSATSSATAFTTGSPASVTAVTVGPQDTAAVGNPTGGWIGASETAYVYAAVSGSNLTSVSATVPGGIGTPATVTMSSITSVTINGVAYNYRGSITTPTSPAAATVSVTAINSSATSSLTSGTIGVDSTAPVQDSGQTVIGRYVTNGSNSAFRGRLGHSTAGSGDMTTAYFTVHDNTTNANVATQTNVPEALNASTGAWDTGTFTLTNNHSYTATIVQYDNAGNVLTSSVTFTQ